MIKRFTIELIFLSLSFNFSLDQSSTYTSALSIKLFSSRKLLSILCRFFTCCFRNMRNVRMNSFFTTAPLHSQDTMVFENNILIENLVDKERGLSHGVFYYFNIHNIPLIVEDWTNPKC